MDKQWTTGRSENILLSPPIAGSGSIKQLTYSSTYWIHWSTEGSIHQNIHYFIRGKTVVSSCIAVRYSFKSAVKWDESSRSMYTIHLSLFD